MSLLERKKELTAEILAMNLVDEDDIRIILSRVEDFDEFEDDVTIIIETGNIGALSEMLIGYM